MKYLPIFTLLCIFFIACGDVEFITKEMIEDTATCFETVDAIDEKYATSLDKNCIDTELSIPPLVPTSIAEPIATQSKWTLIATLERDVRQKHWHEFFVQDDVKSDILTAYTTGQDFLFVIEKVESNTFVPTEFYFMQPEPPTELNVLFFQSSGWFEYWAPDFNWIVRKPEREGLIVFLDPGSPGTNFEHPDNRKKKWVLGNIEFRGTRSKAFLFADSYEPHIRDNILLKVYTR